MLFRSDVAALEEEAARPAVLRAGEELRDVETHRIDAHADLTALPAHDPAAKVDPRALEQPARQQEAVGPRRGVEPDDVEVEGYGGNSGRSFEIKDFSFGVENPTTIGSATGGAGAGKIKFDEFQIGLPPTDAFVGLNSFVGLHIKHP